MGSPSARAQYANAPGVRGLLALAAYLLLGLLFQWTSLHFGFKRYLLNAEMLMAMLLFVAGWRWLGVLVFFAAVCLELTLGATSVFRLIEVAQVGDMAGYLLEAKGTYLVMLVALAVIAAAGFWVAAGSLKGVRWRWLWLCRAGELAFQ